MSLPLNFNRTFRGFRKPVEIELREGYRVDSVWQERILEPARTIEAIVFSLSLQELQFYSNGSDSSGGIALITEEELYYSDALEEGVRRLQHYALYKGYRFKVVASGFMWGNTNKRIYHCLRYYL